jgi:hypothetical protein
MHSQAEGEPKAGYFQQSELVSFVYLGGFIR